MNTTQQNQHEPPQHIDEIIKQFPDIQYLTPRIFDKLNTQIADDFILISQFYEIKSSFTWYNYFKQMGLLA